MGSRIEYVCDEGHLLVGPARRNCLATGFYSEFPPVCRYLECGMPADIVNGQLQFVNGTRQFKSIIRYECDTGYVLVGRNELLCDVDQRWNGPPPRCEPVYCEEPGQIRHGGFSLSTNSTRFGTVVSYFCSRARYSLVGPAKITCLKDGSYNTEPPQCVEAAAARLPPAQEAVPRPQEPLLPLAPGIRKRPVFGDPKRTRPASGDAEPGDRRRPFGRVPFPKKSGDFSPDSPRTRPKEQPSRPRLKEQPSRPRPPIDNEIPDSSNVQNSPAGANEPKPVENNRSETRQAQLNLGE